jgi:hypothetical protein
VQFNFHCFHSIYKKYLLKQKIPAEHWRLTLVLLATQEAEIRRIAVPNQPEQISSQDLISTKPFIQKKKAGEGGW